MIILWGLPKGQIPPGWQVADGTNGTLDLVGCFVRGAANFSQVGVTGGADSQVHTFTTTGHFHSMEAGAPTNIEAGLGIKSVTDIKTDNGTTDSADNKPFHNQAFYIQKVA